MPYPLVIRRGYPGYVLSVGYPVLSVAYPRGLSWISLIPAYPEGGGFSFILSGAGFGLSGLILAYPRVFCWSGFSITYINYFKSFLNV